MYIIYIIHMYNVYIYIFGHRSFPKRPKSAYSTSPPIRSTLSTFKASRRFAAPSFLAGQTVWCCPGPINSSSTVRTHSKEQFLGISYMFKTTLKFVTYWNLQMRSVIHFSWVFFFLRIRKHKKLDLLWPSHPRRWSRAQRKRSFFVQLSASSSSAARISTSSSCPRLSGAWGVVRKKWTSGENSSFRIIIHIHTIKI